MHSGEPMHWIADHLIEIRAATARLDQRLDQTDRMLNETRSHLRRQDRDLAVIKTRLPQRKDTTAELSDIIKALWPVLVVLMAIAARLMGADPQLIQSYVGLVAPQ